MNKSPIEWTDFTSNPLKYRNKVTGEVVWACIHTSPGCEHCYAETLAKRYGRGSAFIAPNMTALEPFMDEKELHVLATSQKLVGKRVFVADMTDLFGEWVDFAILEPLWEVMVTRADVTFQLLTKRAERMRDWSHLMHAEASKPLSNIWWGVTTEDQPRANERIPVLLGTPAAVRWLSVEPQIGPVDLTKVRWGKRAGQLGDFDQFVDPLNRTHVDGMGFERRINQGVNWVVVGGESGPGKRPMEPEWARSLRDQCRASGVSFFMKQMDKVKSIPDDLMVREFPQSAVPHPARGDVNAAIVASGREAR